MHSISCTLSRLVCTSLVLWSCAGGQPQKNPHSLVPVAEARRAAEQELHRMLQGTDGVFATSGYLSRSGSCPQHDAVLSSSIRVLCADRPAYREVMAMFRNSVVDTTLWWPRPAHPLNPPPVSAGARTSLFIKGARVPVLVCTMQQMRWLIWFNEQRCEISADPTDALTRYGLAVLTHLRSVELGEGIPVPDPMDFDVSDSFDFYRPPPDYVIQGYANYKVYLKEHAGIQHDFALGATEVWARDSLLDALKHVVRPVLYPNKEAAGLQIELREFYERGGTTRDLETLNTDAFAKLQPGEYFYGVNASGQVRMGRELPREELDRIQAETGHKAPRANHAFLFPGEPLLTAGAFWIERDSLPHLVAANAGSGHYFYSNIQPSIREDIAVRSDDYLLSIGHLFQALDSLGISYDSVLISKF